MADSYLASNEFPGDGSTTLWNVSFKGNRPDAGSGVVPYLSSADVKAQLITPATATVAEIVVDVPVVYVGPNQFRVTPAAPVGKIVRIYRATQDEYALVDYQSLQTVGEADLDLSNRQLVFITQEAHDLAVRASEDAGNSSTVAYNAIAVANTATVTANSADSKANTAISTANSALGVAANADAKSNTALANAASAEAHATASDVAAAAAQTAADTAQAQATAANIASANAVSVANGVDAKATTALANSITANNTANTATATANGIDAKATTALANANTALTNANAAVTTANGVDAKATTALSNSVTANGNASSAVSTATSALTAAGTAQSAADAAQATANSKAVKGANSDITSLGGLTTPLSVTQGGTGANNATGARSNLALVKAAQESTTAGEILQVGHAGWNCGIAVVKGSGTDLNTLQTATLYACNSTYTNGPALFGGGAIYVRVSVHGAAQYIKQEAMGIGSGLTASRTMVAGTWGAWVNDLRITSTGGTTTNGWNVYSDGTIEQWGEVTVTNDAGGLLFSFNTPFASVVPIFTVTPKVGTRSTTAEANSGGRPESLTQFRITSGFAFTLGFLWYAKGK